MLFQSWPGRAYSRTGPKRGFTSVILSQLSKKKKKNWIWKTILDIFTKCLPRYFTCRCYPSLNLLLCENVHLLKLIVASMWSNTTYLWHFFVRPCPVRSHMASNFIKSKTRFRSWMLVMWQQLLEPLSGSHWVAHSVHLYLMFLVGLVHMTMNNSL